jgi:hypothetical protein
MVDNTIRQESTHLIASGKQKELVYIMKSLPQNPLIY